MGKKDFLGLVMEKFYGGFSKKQRIILENIPIIFNFTY